MQVKTKQLIRTSDHFEKHFTVGWVDNEEPLGHNCTSSEVCVTNDYCDASNVTTAEKNLENRWRCFHLE